MIHLRFIKGVVKKALIFSAIVLVLVASCSCQNKTTSSQSSSQTVQSDKLREIPIFNELIGKYTFYIEEEEGKDYFEFIDSKNFVLEVEMYPEKKRYDNSNCSVKIFERIDQNAIIIIFVTDDCNVFDFIGSKDRLQFSSNSDYFPGIYQKTPIKK